MTFISGTITDANPGPALYAVLAPALTSAGWTLVDTVVISTRTHKVWKSAAASNPANLDWYLDIAYTTTGVGVFTGTVWEFYDPTLDFGYRGPTVVNGTAVPDATTGSRYGSAGNTLENAAWGPVGASGQGDNLPITAFAYWFSVTTTRVMMLNSIGPANIKYWGLYEPNALYATKAGAALFPLVQANLTYGYDSSTNTSQRALTRVPPFTGSLSWSGNQYVTTTAGPITELPAIPGGNTQMYPIVASRIVLQTSTVSSMNAIFGMLYGVACVAAVGVVRGDTVTIGADQWVCTTSSVSLCGLMQAI